MNRLTVMTLAMLLILTGCLPANLPQQPTSTPPLPTPVAPTATLLPTLPPEPTETPSPSLLNLDLLNNFSYWVEDFKIQALLKDGAYDDGKIQAQLIEPVALGDLNGDGREDAAVILAIKSGGTGTFYNLIVILNQNETPVQAASSYIGDRQGIKNLVIANSRIILDYITQGPKDPLCCSSEHRLRSYLLVNGKLLLASEQVLGSQTTQATPLPNAILIDQPVTGDPLTAPLRVHGRVSQVPPEKKLAYFVTDMNRVVLTQGEVNLEGQPGETGDFSFEINLGTVSPGLVQIEIVDSSEGIQRGRSIVVLVAP